MMEKTYSQLISKLHEVAKREVIFFVNENDEVQRHQLFIKRVRGGRLYVAEVTVTYSASRRGYQGVLSTQPQNYYYKRSFQ